MQSRAGCAWKWITEYAPEEFRFQLRTAGAPSAKTELPKAIGDLVRLLEPLKFEQITEDVLTTQIFEITKTHQIQPKEFFAACYMALIAKKNGPKLASFLLAIGKDTALKLLKESL